MTTKNDPDKNFNINNDVKHQKINGIIDLRKCTKEELKKIRSNQSTSNPFEGMKIKDGSFLDKVEGRTLCRNCGKSRKYFCYTCYIPVAEVEKEIPKVKLPCVIDIIKHPRETDGKSTAIHASILAPDDVRIYTYPDIPNYNEEKDVYLIFPDKNATALEKFWCDKSTGEYHRLSEGSELPCRPLARIVFIDSTWNQTKRIQNDERLKDLPCLELQSKETLFWRYQKGKPKTYLATIEAIFYFVKEFHFHFLSGSYCGEYDNLLFFFKYMYEKIHSLYDSETLLAYKDI